MASTTKTVLILSSRTGGGHQSAANALMHSFQCLSTPSFQLFVEAVQVLEEASTLTKPFASFYNYLLRHHQSHMKYYYWAVNQLRLNESQVLFQSSLRFANQLFNQYSPHLLLSVHPMTNHFFAFMLRKRGLLGKVPLVTVVTDPGYGFWRGWACDDVDQYYVASEGARCQLIEYGIPSKRIKISGMPVHARFHSVGADKKLDYKEEFGLDPHKFTVFFNAGWAGGGNISKIFETLVSSEQGPSLADIQVVFLAGKNTALLESVSTIAAKAPFFTRVLGYTEAIEKLMNASDVMVSKLGGLTTYEALACQLPVLADAVTPPMPQEASTGEFLEKTGAGILIRKASEIVSVIQSLQQCNGPLNQMRQAAEQNGKPGASEWIASDLLTMFFTRPVLKAPLLTRT